MTDRRPGKDRIEGKDKAPPCLLHEGSLHEESLLYKNKYRIPSARLQHWDYGWNAAYFVTICTHNRQCFFGEISNGKMELSEMGKTATIYWMEIPDHFPFVNLGAFVVMPNHIHGIVVIDKPQTVNAPIPDPVETPNLGVSTNDVANGVTNDVANGVTNGVTNDVANGVTNDVTNDVANDVANGVTNDVANGVTNMNDKNNDPWKPGTLGVIINQYKRKCTIESRKIDPEFAWQSRFHDHIIRDEKSYQNISQYIINNPANWDDDKFNSDKQGGIQ